MEEIIIQIILSISIASVPLIFAGIGELLVERSGVLNLGVEGMMIVGAVVGFITQYYWGVSGLSVLMAMLSGMMMAGIFAFLTQLLLTNQVATGLALTLFGLGFSAFLGKSFSGETIEKIAAINLPVLSDIPLIGPIFFGHDPLFYLANLTVLVVWWFLHKTRPGLVLRAIGDNHDAAHTLGHRVVRYRVLAIIFGGGAAGIGGAYLSLVQIPIWVENMTAGRGWIALALVVFSSWRPFRILAGAFLFGGISILQLHTQAVGINIEAQYLSMLPYLITIMVLVIINIRSKANKASQSSQPRSLGKLFKPH